MIYDQGAGLWLFSVGWSLDSHLIKEFFLLLDGHKSSIRQVNTFHKAVFCIQQDLLILFYINDLTT